MAAIGASRPLQCAPAKISLMTSNQAAAILVVPALLTNVWQMWNGPDLKIRLRRLWPMLVCALLGTLAAVGILTQGECSPDHRTAWRSPRGLCPDWPHRRPLQSLARTEPCSGR